MNPIGAAAECGTEPITRHAYPMFRRCSWSCSPTRTSPTCVTGSTPASASRSAGRFTRPCCVISRINTPRHMSSSRWRIPRRARRRQQSRAVVARDARSARTYGRPVRIYSLYAYRRRSLRQRHKGRVQPPYGGAAARQDIQLPYNGRQ